MRHSCFVVAPLKVEILRLPVWDKPPLGLANSGSWAAGSVLARAMQCAFVQAGSTGAYEVSLVLSDDAHITKLNHKWRGKNQATNVLAFPIGDMGVDMPPNADQLPLLGDVVVAHETLLTEAEAQNKNPFDHLLHLCVHGMLHLLGYDHMKDDEAAEMVALEKNVLGAFKIDYDMQGDV